MRAKRTFLLFGFLGLWIFISYYILMNQGSTGLQNRSLLSEKLKYLEKSIQQQVEDDHKTVRKIINLIKLKNLQGKNDFNENSIDKNNVNDNVIKEIPLEVTSKDNSLDPKYWTNFTGPVIPVLVFACDRVSVSKCLDNLIEYRPNVHQFPIIVSQVNLITTFTHSTRFDEFYNFTV